MTNLEFYKNEILKNYYKGSSLGYSILQVSTTYGTTIGKAEVIINWLCEEHKENILDDIEREYLCNIIKPFRKDKVTISKHKACLTADEFIKIRVIKENEYNWVINLPSFAENAMYKNMKLNREYSAEELGL